jgi:hypothetical protein
MRRLDGNAMHCRMLAHTHTRVGGDSRRAAPIRSRVRSAPASSPLDDIIGYHRSAMRGVQRCFVHAFDARVFACATGGVVSANSPHASALSLTFARARIDVAPSRVRAAHCSPHQPIRANAYHTRAHTLPHARIDIRYAPTSRSPPLHPPTHTRW